MTNMERSELVIAKILDLLIELGIQESELQFSQLELPEEFAPFFFVCVDWLIAEDIIRVGNIHRFNDHVAAGIVISPTITSSGMAMLGNSVAVGEQTEKLSEVIKKVSQEGTNNAGWGDFVGGMLGGFTKSLGS